MDKKGEAEMHLNAVKNDKYASIIRLDHESHKQKLLDMLEEKNTDYFGVLCKVTRI
jgi:hypothetical protein